MLPGTGGAPSVVLFWHPRREGNRQALDKYATLPWPREMEPAVLDVSAAPATARWFGIRETPALAVIAGGAIMALEYRCQPEVCQRLLQCAARQYRQFRAER